MFTVCLKKGTDPELAALRCVTWALVLRQEHVLYAGKGPEGSGWGRGRKAVAQPCVWPLVCMYVHVCGGKAPRPG